MSWQSDGPAPDVYVACFSDLRRWGGALTAARGLIAAARRRGLSTLLLGVSSQPDDPTATAVTPAELNLRKPSSRWLWRIGSWRTIGQLQRQLRRLPPPRQAFVGISMYWAVAAKRVWPHVPVTYLLPCLLANCLPFTWPRHRPPTFWRRLDFAGISRAERLAFALADRTLAPTRQAHDEVLAFQPAAHGRVDVCTYGCDPEPLSPEMRTTQRQALGLHDDEVMFLLAGVCDLNKAFDYALRELPSIDPRGRLLIVGDGPQRPHLQQLAGDLGIMNRVYFVGPQREMAPWHAAADVVLSTSHYDTFPNAVLEGMCHGRPVVVPRNDPPHVFAGIPEILASSGGGLVYDRRQSGALSAAMNKLIADPVLASSLGQQAQAVARREFRWDRVLDRIAGLDAAAVSPKRRTTSQPEPEPECLHVP